MTVNTNRTARQLRKHLGQPKQYTHSPYQWAYIQAVHAARTTTLSAPCAAGALAIETAIPIEPNALIVVGNGGPVQVESVSGTGPFTLALSNRGVPNAQSSGAAVRVVSTVDLYLDGWQNPPEDLPPGVVQTLTTGVRFLNTYVPQVGHVAIIARGTGLQRADRVVIGALEVQSPQFIGVGAPFQNGWTNEGSPFYTAGFRRVGDKVELRGVVTGGASHSVAFTMPPGYRPLAQVTFAPVAFDSTTQANVGGFVAVSANGDVTIGYATGTSFVCLDGINFSIN